MNKIFVFIVLLLLILAVGCAKQGTTGYPINGNAAYTGYDSNSGGSPITGRMTGTGHERQCY